jgi:hypothetical protein
MVHFQNKLGRRGRYFEEEFHREVWERGGRRRRSLVVAPKGERESREDERKERKKKEAMTEPLYR